MNQEIKKTRNYINAILMLSDITLDEFFNVYDQLKSNGEDYNIHLLKFLARQAGWNAQADDNMDNQFEMINIASNLEVIHPMILDAFLKGVKGESE